MAMKIRNRLTLSYTITVAIILFSVLATIYYFAASYRRADFYEHLKTRALVAATIFLEQDELVKESYERFEKEYLDTLPDEIIQVFDSQNKNTFLKENKRVTYTKARIDEIRKNKEIRFFLDGRQAVGIYYNDNQGDFVIIASAKDQPGFARLKNLGITMSFAFLLALVIIVFTGRFFSKQALEPMKDVVDRTRQITASNLHLRVPEGNGHDEIAGLAITINDMLQRLETSFEVQKTFVSNASHELRTPLTAIIGEIDVFLSKERPLEEYKTTIKNVLKEAQNLSELTNNLLSLAVVNFDKLNINFEEIRLDELIWDIKEDFERHYNLQNPISLNFLRLPDDPAPLAIHGNRQLLSTAFNNLLSNAIKFSNGQTVQCTLEYNISNISITIADQGIGIAPEDMKSIFIPFFRADSARSFLGHGLGLPLAEKIFRMHGAKIEVESELNKGTTFIVSFRV